VNVTDPGPASLDSPLVSGSPEDDTLRPWLMRAIFEHCQEGILITDARKIIIDVNPAFTRITGYPREEILGKKPHILSSGKHSAGFYQNLFFDVAEKGFWSGNIKNRHRSGNHFIAQTTISAVHTASGQLSHYFSIFRGVSGLSGCYAKLKGGRQAKLTTD